MNKVTMSSGETWNVGEKVSFDCVYGYGKGTITGIKMLSGIPYFQIEAETLHDMGKPSNEDWCKRNLRNNGVTGGNLEKIKG